MKAVGERYMVREPQDRVHAASLVKTYPDEQIDALMAIYFQKPHGACSFGGFCKMIPELLQDYLVAKEDMKADRERQAEYDMIERMIATWDEEVGNRREWVDTLEKRIDELTGAKTIPDEETRKALETAMSELNAVHKSILTVVCKKLGVQSVLKIELHRILKDDYTVARDGLVKMLVARNGKGGDK
jgi:hypothetical protein